MLDNTFFTTSDLSIAAYLVMNGLVLSSARRGPSGRFEFIIEDPNKEAAGLSLQYINSDFCKFDNTVRNIKKVLYKN